MSQYPGAGHPQYPGAPHQSSYPGGPQGGFAPPPHGSPAHGHAPPAAAAAAAQTGGGVAATDTSGNFDGLQFRIAHRDSNSLLSVRLAGGTEIKAKPGSMVAMDASVKIKGKMKLSFKKMLSGGEMSESTFTGPGEVLLAPETWGDIVPIHLDGQTPWFFGKDSFLASTRDIVRTSKSQGFGKALFSGEGLFVAQATGRGIVWVQSLGAILTRQLAQGEQWIVDNGHLVAWTAPYKVERIDAGGFMSSSHTDEGLVCRFTGPGVVYIQTRNPETLGSWIAEQIPSQAA